MNMLTSASCSIPNWSNWPKGRLSQDRRTRRLCPRQLGSSSLRFTKIKFFHYLFIYL